MNLIHDLINNQVSELFALVCFFVGVALGCAITKDTEDEWKRVQRNKEIQPDEVAELEPFR